MLYKVAQPRLYFPFTIGAFNFMFFVMRGLNVKRQNIIMMFDCT